MNEKKIIEKLLAGIESEIKPFYTKLWFKSVLWVLIVLYAYGFNWMIDHEVNSLLVLLSASLSGAVIGVFSFLDISEKAWPVVKAHLSKKSLLKRLEELNA